MKKQLTAPVFVAALAAGIVLLLIAGLYTGQRAYAASPWVVQVMPSNSAWSVKYRNANVKKFSTKQSAERTAFPKATTPTAVIAARPARMPKTIRSGGGAPGGISLRVPPPSEFQQG